MFNAHKSILIAMVVAVIAMVFGGCSSSKPVQMSSMEQLLLLDDGYRTKAEQMQLEIDKVAVLNSWRGKFSELHAGFLKVQLAGLQEEFDCATGARTTKPAEPSIDSNILGPKSNQDMRRFLRSR